MCIFKHIHTFKNHHHSLFMFSCSYFFKVYIFVVYSLWIIVSDMFRNLILLNLIQGVLSLYVFLFFNELVIFFATLSVGILRGLGWISIPPEMICVRFCQFPGGTTDWGPLQIKWSIWDFSDLTGGVNLDGKPVTGLLWLHHVRGDFFFSLYWCQCRD